MLEKQRSGLGDQGGDVARSFEDGAERQDRSLAHVPLRRADVLVDKGQHVGHQIVTDLEQGR